MRRSVGSVAFAIVAVLALTGTALGATPFTNFSFENGTTGWTIVSGDVDIAGADVWPAQNGVQSLDLNGFTPGAISQDIPTVTYHTYFVSFYMAGNPGTHETFPNGDASPVLKTMTVTANNAQSDTYTFDTAPYATGTSTLPFPAIGWTVEGYSFRATASTTTVRFTSTTVGAFGPALDNIQYTETVATGANCKDDGWQTMVNTSTGTPFKNQGACVSFYATSGQTPIGN